MLFETANDGRVVCVARAAACVDDDIDGWQFMLVLAKRFADEALDAITPYRSADDAGGNRKSKARSRATGVARENREESVGEAARITINAVEFGFLPEALRRLERPCVSLQVGESNERARGLRCALRRSDACDLSRGAERALGVRIA